MDFADQLQALAKRVNQLKGSIQTEEATKTSLIMPFFQALGYDVFNPFEFVPEYTADIGIKKGEKVDYAILVEDIPTILVEAKWCGETLDKHSGQLFRYFSATKAKFGILTNGVEYRFFTDLEEPNKMDSKPFYTVNILELKEQDISELKKFHKSNFDIEAVFNAAENLKYAGQIKALIKQELDNPSDQFIRFILSAVYDGMKTQAVIEKFKPLVKKSLNQFITDLMNDRITAALQTSNKNEETIADIPAPKEEANVEAPKEEAVPKNKINTTQEELEAFAIVKAILLKTVPPEKVHYRDTVNYFAVLYDNKNYKWICRLKVEKTTKYLILPDSEKPNGNIISIQSINDLFNYADLITASAQKFVDAEK